MLFGHREMQEVLMNMDNQRLREIQKMLSVYHHELKKTDSISESLQLQGHIDKLEKEEQEILKRCDVIIWSIVRLLVMLVHA